jgi:hypothetical protein
MENHNKRLSNVSVGMGGTLIITIFVVLSLTIFATLSFTTAHSDLKLAVKTEKITSDYYETSSKAEKMLSEVYSTMMESRKINAEGTADESKLYFDTLSKKLSGLKDIDFIYEEEKFTVYYESSGEMNQKICVGLEVFYDQNSNEPYYEITSWNLANIELPVYEEENYDLWEGIEIK